MRKILEWNVTVTFIWYLKSIRSAVNESKISIFWILKNVKNKLCGNFICCQIYAKQYICQLLHTAK